MTPAAANRQDLHTIRLCDWDTARQLSSVGPCLCEEEDMRASLKWVVLVISVWVWCLGIKPASAWVKGIQPFPDGEAPVVLHAFCRSTICDETTEQEWRERIQRAIDAWNNTGANFTFQPRAVRATDDPCDLQGAAAVIIADPGNLCPGDGPLPNGGVSGLTEYSRLRQARVYMGGPLVQSGRLLTGILTHEFGHVVGLDHPDEAGQTVRALMNSQIVLGGPAADDIAGIRALYGTRMVDERPTYPPYTGPGFLENPGEGAVSGIGVISGWVCEAREVIIEIEPEWWNDPGDSIWLTAAYGTERLDTLEACGDTDTGFGLLFNWNLLGDGTHTVRALVDGLELGRATVTVARLDRAEFVRGVSGRYRLQDFPWAGRTVVIEWKQSLQNFVITDVE